MHTFGSIEKFASRLSLLERFRTISRPAQNMQRISPTAAKAMYETGTRPVFNFPAGVEGINKMKPDDVGKISPVLAKLLSIHGRDFRSRQLGDVPGAFLDWEGINRTAPKLKIQQSTDNHVAQLLRAALRPVKKPQAGRILDMQEAKKPSDYW